MARTKFAVFFLCLAWDVATREPLRGDEVPPAVDRYSTYLDSVRAIRFSAAIREQVRGKSSSSFVQEEWVVDFEAKRLRRKSKKLDGSQEAGQVNDFSETVMCPDTYWVADAHGRDDDCKVRGAISTYLELPADLWESRSGLGYLCYPFGYFEDGRLVSVLDFLGGAKVRTESTGDRLTLTATRGGEVVFLSGLVRRVLVRIEFASVALRAT